MNASKPWYQSKSVWGSIITLVSMAAAMAGKPVSAADQQAIAELVTVAAASIGGILSLVGRLVANERIGG